MGPGRPTSAPATFQFRRPARSPIRAAVDLLGARPWSLKYFPATAECDWLLVQIGTRRIGNQRFDQFLIDRSSPTLYRTAVTGR